MTQPKVLIAEDDPSIRRGLVDALSFAGYAVVDCADGKSALEMAVETPVDVVLLDVMLPKLDGFAVLDELRRCQPTLPIIMVTARGAEEDRVRGLRDGADDYVVKPFSAKELLARVEAVLRRSPERVAPVKRIVTEAGAIDLSRCEVDRGDGERRSLTQREVDILLYLAMHPERTVDRDELMHRVWGLNPKGIRTRTVDMHIARLREKIEADPADPKIIVTVRGKGYRLGEQVRVE